MREIEYAAGTVDNRVVESPELLGKECCGCLRILEYKFFRRDHTYRDGYRDLCEICASTPRLSIAEHTARQREMNARAVRGQQWEHQDDYRDEVARMGRRMYASQFLAAVKRLVPDLYFMDGRIAGDIAVFRTYGQPQPHLHGRTFEYLWYVPGGLMPEFSTYEFDARDIPVREKQRGWRTPLLRLIKNGLITERQANEVFGEARGPASTVWHRQLRAYRNHTA